MKAKYYTLSYFEDDMLNATDYDYAIKNGKRSFAVKAKRKIKKGDYVRVGNLGGTYFHEFLNSLSTNEAKVVEVWDGLPVKLELPGGKIIEVFGLILELLPALINLWLKIKAIFKK